MADRILIWHIASLPAVTPVYYMERAYRPTALRLYAKRSPTAGELLVDILDDDVSIMRASSHRVEKHTNTPGYIEYAQASGTFTAGETVTGGTSGATAKITSDARGHMVVTD